MSFKMKIISTFIIICLLVTCLYFVGLTKFLTDYAVKQCEMTYMFEYPQFVRIAQDIDKRYPKYELYAYSEGRFTEKARNMDFKGIPVLFIPGNRGSFKQVRSLSSVALRKALNSRTPFHFNYFTVNLNDEFSGLSGVVLKDQLDYVNHSIYRVLDLYEDKKKPKSVILIGHSMGGVIAHSIVSSLPEDSDLVPIFIALAAPLKRPPLVLDYHLEAFYKNIKPTIPKQTTIVSLAGGHSDFLIPSGLTNMTGENIIQVVTTNVPKSWVETNHVEILWCKQIILAINRALFDCVDMRSKQITENVEYRLHVFKHHLVNNSGINIKKLESYDDLTALSAQGSWTEVTNKQFTISLLQGVKQPTWYMVPLTDKLLSILAVNLEVTNWIFACKAVERGSQKICTQGMPLSQNSRIAATVRYKRRTIVVDMEDLRVAHSDFTHIAISVLPTDEPVVLHIDTYGKSARTVSIEVPKLWNFKRQPIITRTNTQALTYNLRLNELQHVMQSYNLHVDPLKCQSKEHHASAQLSVPWANENVYQYFTESKDDVLHIRLENSRPINLGSAAEVTLTLDPSCEYKISISTSLIGTLGQLARHYSVLLFTNVAAVTLMTFRAQLQGYNEKGFPLFFIAMTEGLKPYYVITSAKLLSKFLSFPIFAKYLPAPDWNILRDDNLEFLLLPLLLYMCSVGIVWILAIAFSISVVMLESSVNKITLKFLAKTVRFPVTWTEYLLSAFHKLPFAVACILVFVAIRACGALALCLGTIFYFLKLTQMSQDFIEDALWYFVKKFAKRIKEAIANKFKKKQSKPDVKALEDSKKDIKAIEDSQEHKDKEINGSVVTETNNVTDVKTKINEEKQEETETKINEQADNENNVNKESEERELDNELVASSAQIQEVRDETTPNTEEAIQQVPERFTAHNSIFFHSSIFFIWTLVTIINLPTVLIWAHNSKHSSFLSPDPSFIPGLVLSLCAFPLWQMEFPNRKKWTKELGDLIMAIVVVALIYAPITIYRLSYLLTILMIVVVLHQLLAPSDGNDDECDQRKNNIEERYEKVKAKLD